MQTMHIMADLGPPEKYDLSHEISFSSVYVPLKKIHVVYSNMHLITYY